MMLLNKLTLNKVDDYPVMGMFALLPSNELVMGGVADIYEQLNQLKHFKWQKDMNLMMAVSLFVSQKLEGSNIAQTSINTAVKSVVQAQQAVMISTMAGEIAASSSASGGYLESIIRGAQSTRDIE